MGEIVIDASIVAKWYIAEDLREYALRIRDDYIDGKFKLSAPSLMPFEVLNAARHARKDVNSKVLMEVAESLTFYGIKLYELQGAYSKETVETTLENGITIYDASYVALAKYLQTIMYTSDRNLIANLKKDYREYVKHLEDYNSNSSH